VGLAVVGGVVAELSGRLDRWRRRGVRAEAALMRALHGDDAVRILRDRIAEADRYQERRRLYQVHDEVVRSLS
jgi:hypothetical protein